jgi:radical SAM superfamily enzyme YgiQ (UPF0313 family)
VTAGGHLESTGRRRGQRSIVGRGASDNPRNRFEEIEIQPEPGGTEPEEPGPETIFLRDASRSIVTRNDSLDIGFEASLNLYRGCEHGCSYCVSGETLVLMADGSTRPIQDIRVGDEIYGTVRQGRYRRYVKTSVLAHRQTHKFGRLYT